MFPCVPALASTAASPRWDGLVANPQPRDRARRLLRVREKVMAITLQSEPAAYLLRLLPKRILNASNLKRRIHYG